MGVYRIVVSRVISRVCLDSGYSQVRTVSVVLYSLEESRKDGRNQGSSY